MPLARKGSRGNTESMAEDHDGTDALPLAFRGYAREATDALLDRIDESYRALLKERDELHGRAQRAEARLAQHEKQIEAAGRALVRAEQIRADAESAAAAIKAAVAEEAAEIRHRVDDEARAILASAEHQAAALVEQARPRAEVILGQAEAIRAVAEREAANLRDRAQVEAEAVIRDAERRARLLVENARSSLEERQHEAEEFIDEAKERLGSLVQDLISKTRAISDGPSPFAPTHTELASESALDRDRAAD